MPSLTVFTEAVTRSASEREASPIPWAESDTAPAHASHNKKVENFILGSQLLGRAFELVKHIQFRFALTSPKAEKHRRETGAIWIVLSGSSEQYYYSY
jgi:hypothetical protein